MRLRRLGPAAALAVLALAGCSLLPGGDPAPSTSASTSPASTSAPPNSSPATARPATRSPIPSVVLPSVSLGPTEIPSTPGGARVTTRRIQGRYATASWDIEVPAFSEHPAARQMNRRVAAAVADLVAAAKKATRDDDGARRTLTGTGTTTTNDGRSLQVQIEFSDDLAGTAHPTYSVVTVALGLDPVRPIRLSDVIENPPETLRYLRARVIEVAEQQGDHVERRGLAPDLANWACWQSTPQGLRFCFQDYQLGGHGLRNYTVPWPAARMVLTPYAERVLAPA